MTDIVPTEDDEVADEMDQIVSYDQRSNLDSGVGEEDLLDNEDDDHQTNREESSGDQIDLNRISKSELEEKIRLMQQQIGDVWHQKPEEASNDNFDMPNEEDIVENDSSIELLQQYQ